MIIYVKTRNYVSADFFRLFSQEKRRLHLSNAELEAQPRESVDSSGRCDSCRRDNSVLDCVCAPIASENSLEIFHCQGGEERYSNTHLLNK